VKNRLFQATFPALRRLLAGSALLLGLIQPGSPNPLCAQENSTAGPLVFDETAEYSLAFKGLGAAQASIRFFPGTPQRIEARIDTRGLTSLIFSVHNTYQSHIDPSSGLPIVVEKNIAQSNIRQQLSIRYDRPDNTAESSTPASWSILPGAMDLFTMLFQLRRMSLPPGAKVAFPLDIESQAWLASGQVEKGGEMESPCGRLETRRITLHFSRMNQGSPRAWKTDLLTNRIARPDGMLTLFLGPPPEQIPLLIQFGPPGQQVSMRMKNYTRGNRSCP